DISINTESLSLSDEARLSSSADGEGNSGNLQIQANSLSATGASQLATFISGRKEDGNLITAGDVILKVNGPVIFDGSINTTPSGIFSIVNPEAKGAGGTIDIEADSLSVTNGAQLNTFLSGTGEAGNVKISVNNSVAFDGNVNGISSGIFSNVNSGASGKGGNINITSNTGNFSLTNKAELSAKSSGDGNAGNISVSVPDTFRANDGTVSTISDNNSGGVINVRAPYIRLDGDSDIRTFVTKGEGTGGNIFLTSDLILALSDSDILAFALEGRGGNIKLDTPIFLGFLYQPTPSVTDPRTLDGNGRVDINASGAISDGTITLPDTDPSRGLTPLPTTFVDASELIDESCSLGSTKSSSQFVNTGRGGLPQSPSNPLNPDATVRRLATPIAPQTRSGQSLTPLPDNEESKPIVEAQGWVRLSNGFIRLVAQAPSVTPQGNWQTTTGCYVR
ncbi:MAG: hypothetical protein AAFY21_13860, partial [Cyanobacteria bacterium J06641_2]